MPAADKVHSELKEKKIKLKTMYFYSFLENSITSPKQPVKVAPRVSMPKVRTMSSLSQL